MCLVRTFTERKKKREKKKKKKKACSTGYISASPSRFLFLSSTDLYLIEADNGQERRGEK